MSLPPTYVRISHPIPNPIPDTIVYYHAPNLPPQVEIDSVFTYFNEAGPAQDCPSGEENACQSASDFFYDFAGQQFL